MENNEKHKTTTPKRAAEDNTVEEASKKKIKNKRKKQIKKKSRSQIWLHKQLCKMLGVDYNKLDSTERMKIITCGTEGFKRKDILYCEADKPKDEKGNDCDPCWVKYEQISPIGQIELCTDSGKRTVQGFFARRYQSFTEKDESLKNMAYSNFVGDDGKFLSPNIVALEECRLKREEEVQVGDEDKGTLRSVKQLTGIIEFDGDMPFFYSRDNQNKCAWLPKCYIALVKQGCRAKRAPDRVTYDKIGNLTAKPTKYENTTVPKNFDLVYKRMTTDPDILDIIKTGKHREAFEEASIRVQSDTLIENQTTNIYSALKDLLTVRDDINRRRLLNDQAWYLPTVEELRTTDENGEQRMDVDSDQNPYPYVPPKSMEEIMEEVGVKKKYVKNWITDHGNGDLMVAVTNKSEEEAKELVRKKVIENPPDQNRPRRSNDPKQDAEPYHIKLASTSLMYDTFLRGFSAIPEIAYTNIQNQESESEYIIELLASSEMNKQVAKAAQAEREHRINRTRTVAAASKPKCQMTGCTSKVHPICKQKKFCYRHTEKKMSKVQQKPPTMFWWSL